MKLHVIMLSLLFIAAIPAYDITINLIDKTVEINPTNHVTDSYLAGEWMVELRDDTGVIHSQTTFDPYLILPDNTRALVDEVTVTVNAVPLATQIIIYDNNNQEFIRTKMPVLCGDLKCSEEEKTTCLDDCPPVEEIPNSNIIIEGVEEEKSSIWKVLVVLVCVILIIILLLNIKHTSKPPTN